MDAGERALEAAKEARDDKLRAFSLQVLGLCCMRLARNDEAKRYLEEGLRAASAASDHRRTSAMMHNLAVVAKLAGNRDEALSLFLESLAHARKIGDVGGEALILANIGVLYGERGDNASAMAQLRAGLAICEAHGIVSSRAPPATRMWRRTRTCSPCASRSVAATSPARGRSFATPSRLR